MTKEEFLKIATEKYEEWESTQQGQISGYEYEKSFDKMMVELGQVLFQGSIGEMPANKKKKRQFQADMDP